MNDLNQLGRLSSDPQLVEQYFGKLKAIFVHTLESKPNTKGLVLDLNGLPTAPVNLKDVVIKWLISVNLDRLRDNKEPIITLELVLKCPVWKLVRPPFRYVQLKPEKLLNQSKPLKVIGQKRKLGTINK